MGKTAALQAPAFGFWNCFADLVKVHPYPPPRALTVPSRPAHSPCAARSCRHRPRAARTRTVRAHIAHAHRAAHSPPRPAPSPCAARSCRHRPRAAHSPRTTRAHSTTRIRRHLPRRARSFTPRAVLPAIDAHPAPSSPVPAPRRTCARLHPPSLAPPPLIYRFSRAHRAYIVRTRSSPRRSSETAGL